MKKWETVDTEHVRRLYNANGRGVSIMVNDMKILDWFYQTQPRDEWQFFSYAQTVTMTTRVYTMFLLRYGEV